jgi:ferritin-like metal-binding protein YciE
MPKKIKNLEDLFIYEIKDLYSAEKQLITALPRMAKQAEDEELKSAFETHLEETRKQKEKLEKVFELLEMKPAAKKCEAMAGLIEEGKELLDEDATPETKDAGLIACAQKIEHYEISGYGTAAHFAERLGYQEVFQILSEILEEEKKTDTILNDLAKSSINEKAMA